MLRRAKKPVMLVANKVDEHETTVRLLQSSMHSGWVRCSTSPQQSGAGTGELLDDW
jgi:predicted GTPase